MNDFFSWYLAPWRKIGRRTFNTILFVVALPGLVFWLLGFGESVSGIAGLLNGVADTAGGQLHALQPDTPTMTQMANNLLGQSAPAGGSMLDTIGYWLNGLLWLACIPLVRMRVRDIGHGNGSLWHWVWVLAAFAGTAPDMLAQLGLVFLTPLSTWGAVVSFIVLAILCVKKSPAEDDLDRHDILPPKEYR